MLLPKWSWKQWGPWTSMLTSTTVMIYALGKRRYVFSIFADNSWAWCLSHIHVSGSAYKIVNKRAYHHGTMLISTRLDTLGDLLRTDKVCSILSLLRGNCWMRHFRRPWSRKEWLLFGRPFAICNSSTWMSHTAIFLTLWSKHFKTNIALTKRYVW